MLTAVIGIALWAGLCCLAGEKKIVAASRRKKGHGKRH